MTEPLQPHTGFDWGIYGDATLAGLSTLIPIPLLDMLFEDFFRRRIPGQVARNENERLAPEVIAVLNHTDESCLSGCLLWPFKLVFDFVKSLSKKLLYFLTVKSASDRVSYYWHRAFLLDYALHQGQLTTPGEARRVNCAIQKVIQNVQVSPLSQLANQIVSSSTNIFRALRRARRGEEDPAVEEKRRQLEANWGRFNDYLRALADQYNEAYAACPAQSEPEIRAA